MRGSAWPSSSLYSVCQESWTTACSPNTAKGSPIRSCRRPCCRESSPTPSAGLRLIPPGVSPVDVTSSVTSATYSVTWLPRPPHPVPHSNKQHHRHPWEAVFLCGSPTPYPGLLTASQRLCSLLPSQGILSILTLNALLALLVPSLTSSGLYSSVTFSEKPSWPAVIKL